jgi:hypothetical protein
LFVLGPSGPREPKRMKFFLNILCFHWESLKQGTTAGTAS